MKMTPSERSQSIQEYFFSRKLEEIRQLNALGKNIINLGIGSPDLAPDKAILGTISDSLSDFDSFKYQSYKGIPELESAILAWYNTNYSIKLSEATNAIPLMGSKEGIGFLALAYLNKGDHALIPNPGYPTYSAAIKIAEAEPVPYALVESNNWHPEVSELEQLVTERTKIIFLNYPHMPTGQPASIAQLQKVVDWANKRGIVLCNDNPYSNTLSERPFSIFQLEGAEKCCIELNSLSKSHSMAGVRMGMMVGSEEILHPIFKIQSSFSSGMFKPLQKAAIKALELSSRYYQSVNKIYAARKQSVHQLLDQLQCEYDTDSSGLFVWAKVPPCYKNGLELSDQLLYGASVFITPGIIFGSNGDQYIRVSLCQSEELINQSQERIKQHLEIINT